MLPCNGVIQEVENGSIEVAAIDPVASMQAVENPKLQEVANRVQNKLNKVIIRLQALPGMCRLNGSGIIPVQPAHPLL